MLRELCLSVRDVHYAKTVQVRPMVSEEVDYEFWGPKSSLTPKLVVGLFELGPLLNIGMQANRRQKKQNFVLSY